MGIFDFFKKKSIDNELERALKSAATNTSARAYFYEKLLTEKVFVITRGELSDNRKHQLDEGTLVDIVPFNDGVIPVFTSAQRIFDKGVVKEQVKYLAMKGEDLFNFTKGATFVLNPYSDYGKELLPDEIERLLQGDVEQVAGKSITIEKSTKVHIGQPAVYPTEMINFLKQIFAKEPFIKAAYLGWIFDAGSGEPPHYIFGIDADSDNKNIHNRAGSVAQQFLKQGDIVDFIKIDDSDLSQYFLQNQPFYKR